MFRTFKNVKTTYSKTQFSDLQEVINYIKDDSRPEAEKIKKLRTLEKGTKEFDKIKEFQLPCVLWNFTTNGKRRAEDIIQSTGYIYFDIDDNLDFTFNPEYFTAHWRSVSNTGYGCIVKASGVNQSNFKEAFKYIAELLSIPFDPKVNSISRVNILSFDPNISYNENAQTIDCSFLSTDDITDINTENHQSSTNFSKINSYHWNDENISIRYDNLEEKKSEIQINYDENGVCDLRDNKLFYSSLVIPRNIDNGKRNYILSGIAIKVITLNPDLSDGGLIEFIRKINKSCCRPPMFESEIMPLCRTVLNKREKWLPLDNKKKRFFFDPFLELNPSQKRSFAATYGNKYKGELKKKLISESFAGLLSECREFKIKDIQIETKASPTTIAKYLPEILMEQYGGDIDHIQPFFNAKKQIQKLLGTP
ncbi:hypothetical protein [Chryseobacterium sp.]|uniref:hypothetical protein n=1 Tax=Chryseobacterium sp. TaxID=1871047 RepID=UPI000EC1BCE7|nr:hypothetical protein [Chryseobacterium sp.]HCA08101.1 hypothetical protein [Chryseobacterium sp.]